MTYTRTIYDCHGNPVEVEIEDDAQPTPEEIAEAQQAAMLIRHIATQEIIMPPYEHKYKRKKAKNV